ncbi:DNA cytosine methyltransferase [Comamonas sp. MYb396]|uniref:DNA cytosine methyltransferase n=1 Tax=Comamonas sp. MYb396 TaxID=2745302 RepID=UPI0030A5AB9B
MAAYYNEIDKFAAQTLRNLIAAGHIAPGDVDERSIEDVHPDDLKPYTQCHFFAGVGVWSYALRAAGWPDDRSVWTGSCPCQPFSQAGQGSAFDDERHLWPDFHHLISECRPAAIYGEQVASKDADPWLDLVHTDMEALGYAFGAVAFPSAGVGAPHIRDRTYWLAYPSSERRDGRQDSPGTRGRASFEASRAVGGLANSDQHRRAALSRDRGNDQEHNAEPCSQSGRLANTFGRRDIASVPRADQRGLPEGDGSRQEHSEPGPVNGLWRAADWLLCRDGKWRPVEPGTFPLAHGAAARVGRLRAYGNAINAKAAQVFIEAAMSCIP